MPPDAPGDPKTVPVTAMLPPVEPLLIFSALICTAQAGAADAVPVIVMLIAVTKDAAV